MYNSNKRYYLTVSLSRHIRSVTLIFHLLLLFLCSCKNEKGGLLTYTTEKTDFVNKIKVPGVIEAKSIKSIICPSIGSDATVKYLIPEGTWVKKGDVVCILEASEITSRYLQAVKELDDTKAEYNKALASLELQYAMLEAQVKLIESNTAIIGLDSVKKEFLSPSKKRILELQLEKAAIEKEKTNNKLVLLEKINKSELHKMQLKIDQCQNKVKHAKSKVDLLTIKSDMEGMVIYSMLWTSKEKIREGDIVWDWMEIVKIPDLSGMTVKCFANETHYKQIEKDQKIELTIDAHPEIRLTGKIKNKASVGKPVKEKSQVKQYEVTAALDSTSFTITPGLSVSCDIFINEVPESIVVPVFSVFEYDSSKIVYLSDGDKYVRQKIKTAEQNSKEIIVTAGLREGEIIALTEPPLSMVKDTSQIEKKIPL